MSEILLKARGITRTYESESGDLDVLRGVDLEVRSGEMISIMGQSGVGKSTFLNILGLLDTPTDGVLDVRLEDDSFVDAAQLSKPRLAELRNSYIGFVFQFYHLLPDLNVLENVLLPMMICHTRSQYKARKRELEQRAHELLERVKITARARHRPNQLSGGERQRVAVARALMNEPALVLCDEPTGNLDTQTSDQIHDLFEELNQTLQTTFLIVTHDDSLAKRAGRVLTMVDGRFEQD